MARRKQDENQHPIETTENETQPPCYSVVKIVDKMDSTETSDQVMYRVRWKNTWETEENLQGCEALKCFQNGIEINSDCTAEIINSPGNEETWAVHKILRKGTINGKYLVMWNDSWMRPEQILNLPKLLAEFDAENHLDSNGNNVEVQPRKKRRRSDENVAAKEAESFKPQKNPRPNRIPEKKPASVENNLNIVIDDDDDDDDDKIVKILEIGIWCNVPMFLIQRRNEERIWISTKVANIKYPDDVMDFYEKFIEWPSGENMEHSIQEN